MSRKSHGVLARKLVKRPCKPLGVRALGHDPLGVLLEGVEPGGVAPVLDHNLEPAGRAQALRRAGRRRR